MFDTSWIADLDGMAALLAGRGAANVEQGIGPLTLQAVRDLLRYHHVIVRPVLDLAGQVQVDA